jgi:hypothetical protein
MVAKIEPDSWISTRYIGFINDNIDIDLISKKDPLISQLKKDFSFQEVQISKDENGNVDAVRMNVGMVESKEEKNEIVQLMIGGSQLAVRVLGETNKAALCMEKLIALMKPHLRNPQIFDSEDIRVADDCRCEAFMNFAPQHMLNERYLDIVQRLATQMKSENQNAELQPFHISIAIVVTPKEIPKITGAGSIHDIVRQLREQTSTIPIEIRMRGAEDFAKRKYIFEGRISSDLMRKFVEDLATTFADKG